MGRPSSSLPPVVYPPSEILSRRRWRQSQILTDHFWSRFVRYYLPSLQPRQKWQKSTDNLTVNSVVMMADPQLPRAVWSIGRVIKVNPGADGKVRSAEVKVGDHVYTRPVVRLIVLPELPDDSPSPSLPPLTTQGSQLLLNCGGGCSKVPEAGTLLKPVRERAPQAGNGSAHTPAPFINVTPQPH